MHFKLNDRFRLQITVQGNAYAKPSPAKGKGRKGKAAKASKGGAVKSATISKAPVKATTTFTKATTATAKPARGGVARAARSGLSTRGGVKPSLNLSLARGGAPASKSTNGKPKPTTKSAAPKPWEKAAAQTQAQAQAVPFSPAVEVLAPEGVPPAAATPAAAAENELSKYTSPSTPFRTAAVAGVDVVDLDLSDSDGENDDANANTNAATAAAAPASTGPKHGGVMMFSPPSIASRMPPKPAAPTAAQLARRGEVLMFSPTTAPPLPPTPTSNASSGGSTISTLTMDTGMKVAMAATPSPAENDENRNGANDATTSPSALVRQGPVVSVSKAPPTSEVMVFSPGFNSATPKPTAPPPNLRAHEVMVFSPTVSVTSTFSFKNRRGPAGGKPAGHGKANDSSLVTPSNRSAKSTASLKNTMASGRRSSVSSLANRKSAGVLGDFSKPRLSLSAGFNTPGEWKGWRGGGT